MSEQQMIDCGEGGCNVCSFFSSKFIYYINTAYDYKYCNYYTYYDYYNYYIFYYNFKYNSYQY